MDFPTQSNNILDVAVFKNCNLNASNDEIFTQAYNCSDHKTIKLSMEFPTQVEKPVIENYRSFGSADSSEINRILENVEFSLIYWPGCCWLPRPARALATLVELVSAGHC